MNQIKTVHLPGYRIGLTIAIDANLDDYAATTGRSNGFKVLKLIIIQPTRNKMNFNKILTKFRSSFIIVPSIQVNVDCSILLSLN